MYFSCASFCPVSFIFAAICIKLMADENSVVPLSRLARGLCTYYIVVKIDRIIYKEALGYSAGPEKAVKDQQAMQIVVFDQAVCCLVCMCV